MSRENYSTPLSLDQTGDENLDYNFNISFYE